MCDFIRVFKHAFKGYSLNSMFKNLSLHFIYSCWRL